MLEPLPHGRELARAYAELAARRSAAVAPVEAIAIGRRALELAEQTDDEITAVFALITIGGSEAGDEGVQTLLRGLERAIQAGSQELIARAFVMLGGRAIGRASCRERV